MGTRKKGTELVFHLQWRHKPDNGGDKSNVIGIIDTPASTSNFEKFKSYLLKNSGVAGNDVKVTYITDEGKEWLIDHQECFEIALSTFRLKAKLGEIIYLKLDKISNGKQHLLRKHSTDVETQFDMDSMDNSMLAPPEWFIAYMEQFKRDVIQEITSNVNTLASAEGAAAPLPVPKPEFPKKSKKHALGEKPFFDNTIKPLRFDRKLDMKLERLDAKTKKIKEKKQALLSRFENERSSVFPRSSNVKNVSNVVVDKEEELREDMIAEEVKENPKIPVDTDGKPFLNASLVNAETHESKIRLLGGEVYLHSWEVVNSGKLPWEDVELRLTWGSIEMIPNPRAIKCPSLKPGEKGKVCTTFYIPNIPGTYETYWNFFKKDFRFGHALSCCVLVEEPLRQIFYDVVGARGESSGGGILYNFSKCNPTKLSSVSETDAKTEKIEEPQEEKKPPLKQMDTVHSTISDNKNLDLQCDNVAIKSSDEDMIQLNKSFDELNVTTDSSDSELEVVERPKATNRYGITDEELVCDFSFVPQSSVETKVENEVKPIMEEAAPLTSDDNNNNNGSVDNNSSLEVKAPSASSSECNSRNSYDLLQTLACEENEAEGYVFITVNGDKVKVPKEILHPDLVKEPLIKEKEEKPLTKAPSAEKIEPEAPEPKPFTISVESINSTHSGPGRLFIFPQNQAGYEVLSSSVVTNSEETIPTQQYTWASSDTRYNFQEPQSAGKQEPAEHPLGVNSPEARSTPTATFYPSAPTYTYTYAPCAGSSNPEVSGRYGQYHQEFQHVPNYQQSKACHAQPPQPDVTGQIPQVNVDPHLNRTPVHILPENLVSGAVNVASSAINTARSVINMIVPPKNEPGRWVNGHWVTENQDSLRAKNLCALAEMGFWDADLNATLLARYNDDLTRVINDLLQQ